MPLQETSGAASYDAFGGGAAAIPNYIEDVFSTYLYTGNGSTQTITNGIDLSTKGGLVWTKSRSTANSHFLYDTIRGPNNILFSNQTGANLSFANTLTSFNIAGFTLGAADSSNVNGNLGASWTFREQAKFFDIVTWTGNGSNPRTISHNLGATPGCIIVKKTSATTNWFVYHRGLTNPDLGNIYLNATNAEGNLDAPGWGVTSTGFTARAAASLNDNGATYVAYLFAHNAGGFGLTGTDNVISCGSFTTDSASNATVNLGYEAQWVLTKRVDSTLDWRLFDVMRGMSQTEKRILYPNASSAEETGTHQAIPTATGFTYFSGGIGVSTFIYIAIRRGPMKVPTSGTEVFSPNAFTSSGTSGASFGVGFPSDLFIFKNRGQSTDPFNFRFIDRLRGNNPYLISSSTAAEVSWVNTDSLFTSRQNDIVVNTNSSVINGNGESYIYWNLRRAPGFFDEVCYTGTGVARTVAHNLAAVPELVITKARSSGHWQLYVASLGNTYTISLNGNYAAWVDTSIWNSTNPTAFVFSVNSNSYNNNTGYTYVAYLFATLAGVSKVGSYTGTGTTLAIDCGFTAGSRFVMIKRTDSTGDWYVWDSARGIVAGNDPYLLLNSTAAEVTSTDYIDTASTGFEISSTAPAAINANGGTFIFLAIA